MEEKRDEAVAELRAVLEELEQGEPLSHFIGGHGLMSRLFEFKWDEPPVEIDFSLPYARVLSDEDAQEADNAEIGAAIRMALLLLTVEGLKAVKVLSKEGIKTNVTLIFSANQALLAARAGATYVSPFLGRLDDISSPGIELVENIVDIFRNYDIDTEIIAASIRNTVHVTECALAGADIATVPYAVIEQMTKHPLTDQGIVKFQEDYRKVFGE